MPKRKARHKPAKLPYISKAYRAYTSAYSKRWLGDIWYNAMMSEFDKPGFARRFLARQAGKPLSKDPPKPRIAVPEKLKYRRHVYEYPIPAEWLEFIQKQESSWLKFRKTRPPT